MALVVEDGTGKADADALVSLADFKAYAGAVGNDYSSYADAAIEQAIRRASAFLSNSFGWSGVKTSGRSQALAWPRSGVVDAEGNSIASNDIPVEIENAVCEVAWREVVAPNSMNPDFVASEVVKREKVGPLETEYAASMSSEAARPVLLIVRDMISQFLRTGGASSIAGVSYRV